MAFPPVFTDTWDITQPPDTQLANLLGQDIRNLKLDIMQRLSLLSGTFANQPTPETVNATWGGTGFGLLYFSTDTHQIFQWNGAAWVDISSSFVGNLKIEASNTTPVTVGNTATPTLLMTFNLPAGDIVNVGQFLRITCGGIISVASGGGGIGDFALGLSIAGTQYFSLSATPAAWNSDPWIAKGNFMFDAVGTSGDMRGYLEFASAASGLVLLATQPGDSNNAPVNTTIANTIGLEMTWANANASNTITQNFLLVERVG